MPAKPKIIYPTISRRSLDRLLNQLKREDKRITVDFAKANKGRTALHIGLDHKDREDPLDNLCVDDIISHAGFEFNPCDTLDEKYGAQEKYYLFSSRGSLWTAFGDNGYHNDWTRILIEWGEKLDEETRESVLSEGYSKAHTEVVGYED